LVVWLYNIIGPIVCTNTDCTTEQNITHTLNTKGIQKKLT